MYEILKAESRVSDSYVFPARGLTLRRVEYPDALKLAEIRASELFTEPSF
jgi:hypothetical protein